MESCQLGLEGAKRRRSLGGIDAIQLRLMDNSIISYKKEEGRRSAFKTVYINMICQSYPDESDL